MICFDLNHAIVLLLGKKGHFNNHYNATVSVKI